MLTDFSIEYSQRSDDELLRLASERNTLTAEARAALDDELRRRNLTEADQREHQRFVKRQERREWRPRRWKIPGFKYQMGFRDVLGAFATMALISFTYLAIPSHYQLKPDWAEAAFLVVISSTVIVFAAESLQNVVLWTSLAISSPIHLLVVHALIHRAPNFDRAAKGGAFLGLVIFAVVYASLRYVKRFPKRAADQMLL